MTKDEIIEMAREAASHGVENHRSGEVTYVFYNEHLMNFAKLVAAKHDPKIAIADAYRAGVDSGIAAEREACAKLAEEYGTWGGSNFNEWFNKLAKEIRSKK
jgi:hypothetical protein